MGRRRTYDADAVLTRAMHAFRRKGYAALSMRDMEEATALSAGSIYHAYGDKAGLFDAAFRHYNTAVLQARIDRHAPPEAGVAGLAELFRSLLREPDGGRSGCLITNTAVEFGADAPHPRVREGLDLLARTFADRLAGAGVADHDRVATRLLALYQGVLVLVRAGYPAPDLERMIAAEFDQPRRDGYVH